MQELVEYIVKSLVGDDGEFSIALAEGEKGMDVTITCEKKAIGKVIGKQGRIIKAVRSIVKAAGAKEGKMYNVIVVEAD